MALHVFLIRNYSRPSKAGKLRNWESTLLKSQKLFAIRSQKLMCWYVLICIFIFVKICIFYILIDWFKHLKFFVRDIFCAYSVVIGGLFRATVQQTLTAPFIFASINWTNYTREFKAGRSRVSNLPYCHSKVKLFIFSLSYISNAKSIPIPQHIKAFRDNKRI